MESVKLIVKGGNPAGEHTASLLPHEYFYPASLRIRYPQIPWPDIIWPFTLEKLSTFEHTPSTLTERRLHLPHTTSSSSHQPMMDAL